MRLVPRNFLLDTNALSEETKKRSNTGFMLWLHDTDPERLYTSCLAIGELYRGVELAKNPSQKIKLDKFADNVLDSLSPRILTLDLGACKTWAALWAVAQRAGRMPSAVDSLLAAQAIQHNLTLVTRNIKDFKQFPGLNVFCPWD